MALDRLTAELLRGYQIYPMPDTPTLSALRLYTENEQHWVLVTRKILLTLSEEFARLAESIEPMQ